MQRVLVGRRADRANTHVSAASLAVFRMLFGLVAIFGAVRFLLRDWVGKLYLEPTNHLTYAWFDWVHPMPAPFMQLHMVLLAVLGLCIAVGYHYRIAMAMYAVAFTYVELLDASLYLNHYWFVTLASFVLIFVPLHTMWSFDARAGRVLATNSVPSWAVWTVRGQIAVVYIFAGIAKLQSDWLLHAEPMRMWLADRTDVLLIGPYLDEPSVAFLFSWAGAFFDCTIVGWLLWKRSRPYAYAAVVVFHFMTAVLFQIGIFPWLMIVSTLVFFSPDWPKRFRELPALWKVTPLPAHRVRPIVVLAALAVLEIVIPLRHLVYPGDVRWTEEGYYGSWRVMLTEKGGSLSFDVRDPVTGEQWLVEPTSVLTDWQARQAAIRPELLLTTAHLIAKSYKANGHGDVEVRAKSFVSFNGRSNQRMIDPAIDLARVQRGPGHKSFILPLDPAVKS